MKRAPDCQQIEAPSLLEQLSACIHCGMCLPTCPTYRVTGSEAESPRGRLLLMKALEHGKLASPQQLAEHLDPCLGCLACTTACPSGVDYEAVLLKSRTALLPQQSKIKRWIRRLLFRFLLPNAFLLTVASTALTMLHRSGIAALLLHPKLLGQLGSFGRMVQFTPKPNATAPIQAGKTYGENKRGKVALFTGCIMNATFANVHWATIHVLVANGYQVSIPPAQTCCGALAHHAAENDIAAELAHKNITVFQAENWDYIVVNAAGCGSTLKAYPDVNHQQPDSLSLSSKVVDVMELLAQHPLYPPKHHVPLRVTYHAACHLHHAQNIQQEPYAVLQQLPGLTLIPLTEADMCCGSAGVYNLAHPDMSHAILDEKMRHITHTHADIVLSGNPGCTLQIQAGIHKHRLPIKVMHPIEILALAYAGTAL